MIEKYCGKNNIKFEILENTDFNINLRIEEDISKFKKLKGLHRLVRISPFGKGDKLHTSLCKVDVYKLKNKYDVVLSEKDLRIDYYKAPGPGGQNKNKSMSAVRMVHIPTGIIITSCSERSQLDNKKYAYEQMQHKLESILDNKIKDNMKNQRNNKINNDEIVITYYFNHKFAIHEIDNKKTTLLKNLLNGDISLLTE